MEGFLGLVFASALMVGCAGNHSASSLPQVAESSEHEKKPEAHRLLVPGPATTITTSPNGIYMGVYDNTGNEPNSSPHPEISGLETTLGRTFAINLHYVSWDAVPRIVPSPNATCSPSGNNYGICLDVQGDATNGRIPLISWNCGDFDSNVAQASSSAPPGSKALTDYNIITNAADAFHAYGHPVMVRWFWEMNLGSADQNRTDCAGTDDAGGVFNPTDFIKAWINLRQLVINEYSKYKWANNITWVWNPGGLRSDNMSSYFPGTSYVDWLGVDIYDRQVVGLAANLDVAGAPNPNYPDAPPIYTTLQGLSTSMPIIIAENGSYPTPASMPSPGENQICYFYGGNFASPCAFATTAPDANANAGLDAILKAHPQIHAYNYYDGATPSDDWILDVAGTPTGLSAYKAFFDGAYESLSPVTAATATPAPVAISAMGPITFFTGSAEPTLSTAPALGDYLLAIGTTTSGSLAAPSGWSKLAGAGQAGVTLFYGPVGGSGGISPATTYNFGGTETIMQLFDLTGATGSPVHTSLATQNVNGSVTTPSLTTSQSNDLNLYTLALNFSPQSTGWSISNSSGVNSSPLGQLVDKDTGGAVFLSLYNYQVTSAGPLSNFSVTSTMTASPSVQAAAGAIIISVQHQ